ncbi:unnamed protein product [Sphenostylis stenocarpa]|uniref:Uncharacterized protein n=1 Tax=Sphenostylis stenocarpa TaxID=92480 RepID=A0AA86TK92_9FABA|nr:unnamed protein product [Sphenostylis stenocarpa]
MEGSLSLSIVKEWYMHPFARRVVKLSDGESKANCGWAISTLTRLPYVAMASQAHGGSFSKGSWIGEMKQASDKTVIISEILDPRTKNLLSMSRISDYVLSNELVSMALAMVAEDRQINDVLEELFAEEGNEMHIRQADLYLCEGEELSFYEIMLRSRQRREIVIGYRLANAERAVINPPAKTDRRKWSLKDVFVNIAHFGTVCHHVCKKTMKGDVDGT